MYGTVSVRLQREPLRVREVPRRPLLEARLPPGRGRRPRRLRRLQGVPHRPARRHRQRVADPRGRPARVHADPDVDGEFEYTAAQLTKYAYIANVMNDTHMSHAMEFAYPQTMANCVTCHEGKLAQVILRRELQAGGLQELSPGHRPRRPVPEARSPRSGASGDATSSWASPADLYTTPLPRLQQLPQAGGSGPTFAALHLGFNNDLPTPPARTPGRSTRRPCKARSTARPSTLRRTRWHRELRRGRRHDDRRGHRHDVVASLYGYDRRTSSSPATAALPDRVHRHRRGVRGDRSDAHRRPGPATAGSCPSTCPRGAPGSPPSRSSGWRSASFRRSPSTRVGGVDRPRELGGRRDRRDPDVRPEPDGRLTRASPPPRLRQEHRRPGEVQRLPRRARHDVPRPELRQRGHGRLPPLPHGPQRGSHIEMQSRSIDCYVHSIHAMQVLDAKTQPERCGREAPYDTTSRATTRTSPGR